MYAKYLITNALRDYICTVREKHLGYTYEKMAEVFDNYSEGWFHGVARGPKPKYISIDDLEFFFLIDYNCHVFQSRISKMKKYIELRNDDNTAENIFDCFEEITYTENGKEICKYMPETSIFTQGTDSCDRLFSNEVFEDCPQYILMNKLTSTKDSFTLDEYVMFSKFIEKRTKQLLGTIGLAEISLQYWLYAMNLLYAEVSIGNQIESYISRSYFHKREHEFSWNAVFESLRKNSLDDKYENKFAIYFKNDASNDISRRNIPIMYVNYDFSESGTIIDTLKNHAMQGKLRIIDLFMLMFYDFTNQGLSEEHAFEKTCIMLSNYNVEPPFANLNLVDLPKVEEINITGCMPDFIELAIKFFSNAKFTEKDADLKIFKDNLLSNNKHLEFLRTISVDFKFIKDLNMYSISELRNRIEKTVEIFKDENLM